MIIYLARNTRNGHGYVGQTSRALKKRWREHVYSARTGCTAMPLFAAIRKHGPDAFELTVLQECNTGPELDDAERHWIRELGTLREGYNATEGGHGISGYRHTAEAKARMSEARRGEGNPNWGGLSESHKRNLAAAKVGTGTAPRFHMRGRPRPKSVRHKISLGSRRAKVPVAVQQLDTDGGVIATYRSMSEAAQAIGGTGPGIKRCCEGQRSYRGFNWCYLREEKG